MGNGVMFQRNSEEHSQRQDCAVPPIAEMDRAFVLGMFKTKPDFFRLYALPHVVNATDVFLPDDLLGTPVHCMENISQV